ncbi:MAG: hypothetical protein K0U98_21140 [Deltaproteobacteria bacterium]|nr:hypothetical protein [Deltaproteobacteria bacterium]
MRQYIAPIAFFALGLLAVEPVCAAVQSFAGSTVNQPRWNRPIESGPNISAFAVTYSRQNFFLPEEAFCTINSSQDFDGYLHLYRNIFNPDQPLDNLVEGANDGSLGPGSSQIPADPTSTSLLLFSGSYTLVTSGFDELSQGTFQNTIQCDGGVQPQSSCFQSGTDRSKNVCLRNSFAVRVDQVTNHASDGVATPVRFASTDSAFFWFFSPLNYEVIVKIINGCSVNGHFWVFAAGTTNQGHRISVFTLGSPAQFYTRSEGPPAPAITDTAAFPCL